MRHHIEIEYRDFVHNKINKKESNIEKLKLQKKNIYIYSFTATQNEVICVHK